MKRILLFFLFVSLFACEKEISEKQADYFLKFYGTYLNDYSSDLQELPDGGYVILGTSEVEGRGMDISLVRTDKYGRQVGETRYYGTEGDDIGNGILVLNDGFLISGATSNPDGTHNATLVKTDFSGIQTSELIREDTGEESEAYDAIQKDNGGYLFVGYIGAKRFYYSVSYDDNFQNPHVTMGSIDNKGDGIVLKKICKYRENQYLSAGIKIDESTNKSQVSFVFLNEDGNPENTEYFGNPANENDFASLVQQNDSTIFVLSTLREGGSGTPKLSLLKIVYKIDPTNPYSFLYIQEESSNTISGTGSLEANSLAIREDGTMIMLATKTFAGDKNILLYQLDKDGNQIGSPKEFGGKGDQSGSALLYSEGSIVILGSNSFDGNSMLSLIKTDNQGNLWD